MAPRTTGWLAVIGGTALLALALQALVRRQLEPRPAAPSRCEGCHEGVTGIERAHEHVGCSGCHLGDPRAPRAEAGHIGLVRLPGQLVDVDGTCGKVDCHPALPARLRGNIMTTMNGVVSIDRWVFAEQPTKLARTPVTSLGHSPADTHLRNLCASCHLGATKAEAGPVTERSRGGGCLACHLEYGEEAVRDLARRRTDGGAALRFAHARLSSRVPDSACFGCHSRSGRVSLNYQGWHEGGPPDGGDGEARVLEDGRTVWRAVADVHAERGLGCTDCHGSWEVMGDGRQPLDREAQAVVACTDCHRDTPPPSRALEALDPESRRLAERDGLADAPRRFVVSERRGVPLVGTWVEEDGGVWTRARATRRTARAAAPARACGQDGVHRRVSCPACHESWAPQCVTCHTRFEPDAVMFDLLEHREAPGAWLETGGPTLVEPPVLGVRVADGGAVRFAGFAPGMVLTIDLSSATSPGSETGRAVGFDGGAAPAPAHFRRLFAPIVAHTVRREARPCEGCHARPEALGYGHGRLSFTTRQGRIHVSFAPSAPPRLEDGLPTDAWIGFLAARGTESTTRDDARPLSVEEQRRVLTVGACLTCHPPAAPPWHQTLDRPGLPPRSPRCPTGPW